MAAVHQPDGAAFDIVLLGHVACVAVGLVTTTAAAASSSRLRRLLRSGAALPGPLLRYFRPGVNWAGRTIYGIPVFGLALVGMSQGAYALRDGWVLTGLAVFASVVLLAEGVLWPAERRIQLALLETVPGVSGPPEAATPMERDAGSMNRAATIMLALLVLATVVMVAQP